MKKQTAALLLSLSLLAGCLVGCAPQNAAVSASPAAAPAEGVDLTILYEADEDMINNYSLLAVNPDAPFADADGNPVSDVYINMEGAAALINWMLSEEGKAAIADYGYADYGEHLFYLTEDGPTSAADIPQATDQTKVIRMSTTTSVNDSGLLAYLLPLFEDAYGYTVEVTSAGTGKAIANAQNGNADLLLVHSKSQEEAFVDGGYSYVLPGFDSERLTFMYNYFVLCGPSADPAGVKEAATVKDAFAAIAEGKYPFVSRGDQSGTHTKEISLWPEDLGITTDAASVEGYADWYTYSNAGMGVCLTMAEETGAYILSDKATFLTFQANNGAIE
ncbi:substrate-binding domain-containing protein [Intestinimonas massiliensis (ex Afouda et al. 2020)]|uniref:substrate-binding domain-containing protein n=1 Tax=Intestinimonas massiliensis (ex Afouda et al. 2020) TaxID=1673721 RepID=UPI0010313AEF|nr:substrate-binding domain-containing protein [Intestinimonas massiliensis (ex Afouda et al. 2020)]